MNEERDRRPTARHKKPRTDDTTLVISTGTAAPRSTPPDRCTVTVLAGPAAGTVITLDGPSITIGRADDVELRIDDPGLSRRHTRIYRENGIVMAEDLKSRNGTAVDGKQLDAPIRLHDGARVRIGQGSVLRIEIHDALEQEATRRLYESSVRDPLTRLFNRRHLDERLSAEVSHATRHATALSLILIDLDHFKQVNDDPGLGHLAGDAVLRIAAATVQKLVRTEDLVARYGGEELVVVTRSTNLRNAAILAERIRKAIEALQIPWDTRTVRVTASFGVASLEQVAAPQTPEGLFMRCDEALYLAKNGGRNRVVVAE